MAYQICKVLKFLMIFGILSGKPSDSVLRRIQFCISGIFRIHFRHISDVQRNRVKAITTVFRKTDYTVERICNSLSQTRDLQIRALIGQGHIDVADDRPQHIVEIMGYPSSQSSDGFHLLGMMELLLKLFPLVLGTFALSDIADGFDDAHDVACAVKEQTGCCKDIGAFVIVEGGSEGFGMDDFFSPGVQTLAYEH